MPFVFLAAVAAATVYLLRIRRAEISPQALGVCAPIAIRAASPPRLVGIRGWLLLYS